VAAVGGDTQVAVASLCRADLRAEVVRLRQVTLASEEAGKLRRQLLARQGEVTRLRAEVEDLRTELQAWQGDAL